MPFQPQRMPRIDTSRFSMVPRPDIPRSTFTTSHGHKSTFNTGDLVPIFVDEVIPGDVHQGSATIFARLATPLFPIMDQLYLETFFFFVPNRLIWDNWVKMMGERRNPDDSISYTVPQVVSPAGGFDVGSLFDHFGLPTVGQVEGAGTVSVNALPLRAYSLIWNEWFRDQNLQDSLTVNLDDGPDPESDYGMQYRNKRHDYFTSALPWPLKGGTEVSMLGNAGLAPVVGIGVNTTAANSAVIGPSMWETDAASATVLGSGTSKPYWTGSNLFILGETNGFVPSATNTPQIYADLSDAAGATINALRLAVQTQRLLERDARGGTRYVELLKSHFGVQPQDSRLQRPEYIGGGISHLQTSAIPQTSATGLTGGTSPLGALGATGIVSGTHSFSYSATEHGYIIGLANVSSELTYQQGLHRMWTRSTRYDFYWPVFAHLGEQAIRNDEIFVRGSAAATFGGDSGVWGYQERWAEYRHRPSRITGYFKSTSAGNIDEWHLAEDFASIPLLNETFISQSFVTGAVARALAAGSAANGMQVLFDSVFKIKSTRPMPMFSVPGMMDRF